MKSFKFLPDEWQFGTVKIKWQEMARLKSLHQTYVTTTAQLEIIGSLLGQTDFPEHHLRQSIEHVCGWGCYQGIAGRVLQSNPIDKIQKAFRCAWAASDAEKAMRSLKQIKGFGVSFASKHLRMLRPEVYGVLDSILWNVGGEIGTLHKPESYGAFCRGLTLVAKKYKETEWGSQESLWRVADVEMALFAKCRWT